MPVGPLAVADEVNHRPAVEGHQADRGGSRPEVREARRLRRGTQVRRGAEPARPALRRRFLRLSAGRQEAPVAGTRAGVPARRAAADDGRGAEAPHVHPGAGDHALHGGGRGDDARRGRPRLDPRLGFPAWTGGTLSYIDTVGIRNFVAECDRLAKRYGKRFKPSKWLRSGRSATSRSTPWREAARPGLPDPAGTPGGPRRAARVRLPPFDRLFFSRMTTDETDPCRFRLRFVTA